MERTADVHTAVAAFWLYRQDERSHSELDPLSTKTSPLVASDGNSLIYRHGSCSFCIIWLAVAAPQS